MDRTPDLRILQWNVRSLSARLPDLQHLVAVASPHVILIAETWLQPRTTLSVPGFQLLRQDRPGDPHGGVAIAVRRDIPCQRVQLPDTEVEAVAAQLVLPQGDVTVLSLYVAYPNAERTRSFSQILSSIRGTVIAGGDLNAKHQAWGSPLTTTAGRDTLDAFCNIGGLHLLNDRSPTCFPPHSRPSHLDLSFCSSSLAIRTSWRTMASSATDHAPILMTVDNRGPPDRCYIRRLDHSAASRTAYSKTVSTLLPSHSPLSTPDSLAQSLSSALSSASALVCPPRRCPVQPRLPPWWNSEVRKAVADRNTARHRAMRSCCPALRLAYRVAYARARFVMKDARRNHWRSLCSSLTPSSSLSWVWRMAKGAPPRAAIPPLSDSRGFQAVSALERSSTLLHSFFPPSPRPPSAVAALQLVPFSYVCDTTDLDQPFTMDELDRVLSSVRNGSPGPDGVTYTMLKSLDATAKNTLLTTFNHSFLHRTCPAAWKLARVCPLRKPAKPAADPAGYRPISLVSCVGKVMERLVLRRLLWHLDRHGLSCAQQYGFKAGHSTVEPLVHLVSDAKRSILDLHYTVVVFLDIKKAFDSVWHEAVLAKLRQCGVTGLVYDWICSFLADRRYQLRVDDAVSECQPEVGVPQGSVLSPRLFNLVMDGLGESLPEHVNPGLFADDGTFWTTSPSLPEALARMQGALDLLSDYGDTWGLSISSEKTDFMVIGPRGVRRLLPATSLTLKGLPLPQVRSKRILGLHLNDRLTWRDHVDYLKSRSCRTVSLLRCLSGTSWGAERKTLLQIFRALLLSRVSYAAPAWPDLPDALQASLEVIQNNALRAITSLPRNTAVAALQVETNVQPLKLRQELLTTQYFVKLKARFPALYTAVSRPSSRWWMLGNRDPATLCSDALENWGVPEIIHDVDMEHLSSRLPPWSTGHPGHSFDTEWLAQPKQSLPSDQLRALALARISSVQADACVYTDGSRSASIDRCGLGAFWPRDGSSISHRLPDLLSITTVELYAILFAIRATPPADHLLVCSDSRAALTLLQDHQEPTCLVRTTLSEATSRFQSTTFLWVPSHCGIPGNEAADRAAVAALDLTDITKVPLPRRDLNRLLSRHSRASWCERWSAGVTGRVLFEVKPVPGPWSEGASLSRKETTVLTALRCGRARLPEYQHRIGEAASPNCTACGTLGDVKHLFFDCFLFHDQRLALRTTLTALGVPFTLSSLLGNLPRSTCGQAVKATLEFLKDCRLFDHLR